MAATAVLQPARAICSAPRLIVSFGYVITPGCEAGGCGTADTSITNDARGAFWALGDGDPQVGTGIDSGSYACLGGWCYVYPGYSAWINTTWAADTGIDGCIDDAGDSRKCLAVLLMDNAPGLATGAFAFLTDAPDAFGDYNPSGHQNIPLTALAAPTITDSVILGGGTGVEVTIDGVSLADISAGLRLDPACGSGAILGYQVFAQETPPGGTPAGNAVATWTSVGPVTPLGQPATVHLSCPAAAGVRKYLAVGLAFDSGYGTVWLSGHSAPVECGGSCTPSPEVCDGLDNDCDGSVPADELDGDGDGLAPCAGDCDDAVPATFPGAPEVNDARDNQCPGDPGHGFVDEISGLSGFRDVDPARFSWTQQAGATSYQVLRSTTPDFSAGLVVFDPTPLDFVSDPETPPPAGVLHYLVRATAPNQGDLGR